MVPEADLHGDEGNASFNESAGEHEGLPVPEGVLGRYVFEFRPAATISIQHRLRLVADVKRLAGLAAGEHVEGLGGVGVHRAHLAGGIDVAADAIERIEKLLAVAKASEIDRFGDFEVLDAFALGHERTILRAGPKRIFGLGDLAVAPLETDEFGHCAVALRKAADAG